ncbi:hypothetical protein [Shimia sp. SK013]|nr:hypothetical protein [Shimia sp. SK013]
MAGLVASQAAMAVRLAQKAVVEWTASAAPLAPEWPVASVPRRGARSVVG